MVKEPEEFWVEFWVVCSSCESLRIPQKAPLIPLRRLPWHCRASSKCGITTGWAVSALQEPWSIPSSWRQHDIITQASQSFSVNLREIFSVRFSYSMSYSSDKTNRPLLRVRWDVSLFILWDKKNNNNSQCNSKVLLKLIDSWLKGLKRMNKRCLNENQVNVCNRLLCLMRKCNLSNQ